MKKQLGTIINNFLPALLTFFAPISGLAIGIGLLIFLDTILGITAAYKNGEAITSRKASNVVTKSLLYLGLLYLIFPVDYLLLNELTKKFVEVDHLVVKLVAVTIVSIEIKSINENVYRITKVDMWVKFKELLKRSSEIKKDVGDVIDK